MKFDRTGWITTVIVIAAVGCASTEPSTASTISGTSSTDAPDGPSTGATTGGSGAPAKPNAKEKDASADAPSSSSSTCSSGQWCLLFTDPAKEVFGISGITSTDVWIVGSRIFHFDGATWKDPIAGDPWKYDWSNVYARTSTDVWFVALNEAPHHWNGAALTTSAVQDPPPPLLAVWAAASNDVWAVGGEQQGSYGQIWHFDGVAWSDTGDRQLPWRGTGVWGTDTGVWACGNGIAATDSTLLETAGGTSPWTAAKAAFPVGQGAQSVWASSSMDVWAAGASVIERFDGSSWSALSTSPVTISGTSRHIHGRASNDVWIVSSGKSADGGVYHWNGTTWSDVTPQPKADYGYAAVWESPAGDVFVGSVLGDVLRRAP